MRIAVIDDDKIQMRYYLEAFAAEGYVPSLFMSPKSMLTRLKKGESFDLYVVDVMMNSRGTYKSKDTESDLYTGVALAKDIRLYDSEAPIVLFTNMNVDGLFMRMNKMICKIPNLGVLKKSEFPPAAFAQAMGQLYRGETITQKQRMANTIWDSLIIQPNFFGMGFDIKKLFR